MKGSTVYRSVQDVLVLITYDVGGNMLCHVNLYRIFISIFTLMCIFFFYCVQKKYFIYIIIFSLRIDLHLYVSIIGYAFIEMFRQDPYLMYAIHNDEICKDCLYLKDDFFIEF